MNVTARVILAALSFAAISACGAATDTAAIVPQTSGSVAGSDSLAQDVVLGAQPINATIPTVANISGSMVFPAVSTPTTVELTASSSAPNGVALQSVRPAQSGGTLTVYHYVTMTPKTTVTMPSIPAMSLTFPASTPISGKTFYSGISDLNKQGGSISFDTQGPAQVSGNTVSFAAVPTPLTLEAGHPYTFLVYATASTTVAKIYVANAGNNSVTSYMLDGTQTTPTIHAGLSGPSSVAVDSAGKIYVVNAGSSSITTYNADGSQTQPTITKGLSGPIAVGVDGTGKIYVLNYNTYVVTTYNADGSQTTPTITGLNQPSAMAVDQTGEVYITNFGYRTFDSGVTTYNPDGSLGKVQISSAYLQPEFIAVGATGKIYVDFQLPGILVAYSANGALSTPSINVATPYAFAVDNTGKIYGTNPLTNTISTFDASGAPIAPTITAGLDKPSAIIVH